MTKGGGRVKISKKSDDVICVWFLSWGCAKEVVEIASNVLKHSNSRL